MNLQDKIIFVFLIILVILPVIYTNITTREITATDWIYRHTVWIQSYINGEWRASLDYPPLFHLLMLPFVFINFPMWIFQIVFSILNLSIILWYFHKEHDGEPMIYVTLFLASSIIYMQISSALMPQALDLLLFLPILYFYFSKKYSFSLLLFIPMFLLHQSAMIFAGALLMHSLIYKRYKFSIILLAIMLLFVPINYLRWSAIDQTSQGMILPAFRWDAKTQLEYEEWFYTPFWKFFATSGILAWMYLPFAINNLKNRKFYMSEKQILYALWALSFIPLAILGYGVWRIATFSMIPFFFFIASLLGKDDKNDIKNAFIKNFGELT